MPPLPREVFRNPYDVVAKDPHTRYSGLLSPMRNLIIRESWQEDDLFVGSTHAGSDILHAGHVDGNATNEAGERLPPITAAFASDNLDVGIFAAAVWSRDGWSGWRTYERNDAIQHEFFAAPIVLQRAFLGGGGTLYRVGREYFSRYEHIPGQYISNTPEIPVKAAYPVHLVDMRARVIGLPHLLHARDGTPLRTGQGYGPEVDIPALLEVIRERTPFIEDRAGTAQLLASIAISPPPPAHWYGAHELV